MVCCIDANTFVWGVKNQCDPGQEDFRDRTMHLFDWIDTNGHKLMIPTIVIAEGLAREPLEKHPVFLEKVYKKAIVPDFDIFCASQFAYLFMNRIDELKKQSKDQNIDWQKMKVDHLIIATAIAHKADCIYSNDSGIKSFGHKFIDVRELPPLPPPKYIQQTFLI